MLKNTFNITIYSENTSDLLIRISSMFLRRRINIESLNIAASEVVGIYRFTIVIKETRELVKKLSTQIDKQIGVFKTFFQTDEDIVALEHVLYKVSSPLEAMEKVLEATGIRCIYVHNNYTVLEITSNTEIISAVTFVLTPFGIIEITKSGRIGIITESLAIHERLKEIEPLKFI